MGSLRKCLWATPLLAALPAPAAGQGMCAALDRIATASREAVPFGSLADAARTGDLVPGFDRGQCQVTAGARVSCYRNLAPESLELGAMERTLRDCLRSAPVSTGSSPVRIPSRELAFVASGLRYRIAAYCDHHCRAGLLAWFEVAFEAARPED